MHLLNRQYSLLMPSPLQDGDDADMLQADVMRFMAILGFCLLVVFALMKSLPADRSAPSLVHAQGLVDRVDELNRQVVSLQGKIKELDQDTRESQSIKKQAEKDLLAVKKGLAEIKVEIRARQKALSAIKEAIEKEKRKLTQIEQAVAQQSMDRSKAPKDQVAASQSVTETEEEGFSLHFKNDRVLMRLVEKKRVMFWAVVGGKAWQLSYTRGTPGIETAALPGKYYEMMPATVPDLFRQAFSSHVAAFGSHTVKWGVSLPSDMEGQIAQVVSQHRGGRMVIQEDGRIYINQTESGEEAP